MDIAELERRAEDIRDQAEASGLDEDMSFSTTYDRYIKQLKILKALGEVIDDITENGSILLQREYIKGQENTIVHPAIREYNNTAAGANRTLATLLKILRERKEEGAKKDPLMELINGGGK
jgi:hypothetical protein